MKYSTITELQADQTKTIIYFIPDFGLPYHVHISKDGIGSVEARGKTESEAIEKALTAWDAIS